MACIKTKYRTKEFALQDIDRIKKTSTRSRIPIRAYLCECGSWHLTSSQENMKGKIAELEAEIEGLKKVNEQYHSVTWHQHTIELRKDDRIKELQTTVKNKSEEIKKLRKTINELIIKLNQNESRKTD